MVTPFIAERVWERKAFPVELAKCSNCGFMFFNPRMNPEEEQKLYEGYRDAKYLQMRAKHEPWYTEAINQELGADTQALFHRRQLLKNVMVQYAEAGIVNSVLDFGGDQGQLIQEFPAEQRCVYDISGTAARDGVMAMPSYSDCHARSWDLIVCSHVLEHVAFPRQILSQMKKISRPGTLVYLEVPLESPFAIITMVKRVAQLLVLCATRMRDAFAVLRPSAIFLMHEHLNFFSSRSLRMLAQSEGFEMIASGQYRSEANILWRGNCIWCLARVAK
jgi:2-polyprenyl-3-methyl-5-hydroxy-6-metoxy-1,4-benzoquinol methylase